mmetsp:Transcript_20905/g.27489  ORF Transcript_20905/g.27489 Transcript_20905/m.27489 type:complete len:254 (-) Transcript_20905:276-1037(-)
MAAMIENSLNKSVWEKNLSNVMSFLHESDLTRPTLVNREWQHQLVKVPKSEGADGLKVISKNIVEISSYLQAMDILNGLTLVSRNWKDELGKRKASQPNFSLKDVLEKNMVEISGNLDLRDILHGPYLVNTEWKKLMKESCFQKKRNTVWKENLHEITRSLFLNEIILGPSSVSSVWRKRLKEITFERQWQSMLPAKARVLPGLMDEEQILEDGGLQHKIFSKIISFLQPSDKALAMIANQQWKKEFLLNAEM